MKRVTLSTLIILLSINLSSQDSTISWDEYVQELYDEVQESGDNEANINLLLLELEKIHHNPIDLNRANTETLSILPFLSNEEIDKILLYIHRHERIDSWGELRLIKGLRIESIRTLPLFCTISTPPSGKNKYRKNTTHTIDSRLDIPLYTRQGQMADATGNTAYVGSKLYHRMRYGFDTGRVRASVYTEKDAGERFFDFYGAYIEAKDLGIISHLVVGDYRVGSGEGLVMGCYANSKSSVSPRMSQGILPQQGTMEYGILRGAALNISRSDWQVLLFGSYSPMDATIVNNEAQTILTTGLHRTTTELERKHNLHETLIGTRVTWDKRLRSGHLRLGLTGTWRHTSVPLNPRPQHTSSTIYRDIYPKGNNWGVIGLSYDWSAYRWSFAGETATSLSDWATIGRLSYKASSRFETNISGRWYGERFHSAHATSLSENSNRQNELGLLVCFISRPWDMILIEGYADFFYFRWPRYGMSKSDSGQDFMGKVTFTPTSYHSITLRYNLKRKSAYDIMNNRHTMRLQYVCAPHKKLKLQTTLTMRRLSLNDATGTGHLGWGAMQYIKLQLLKNRLQTSLSTGYFDTPTYANSIYLYEPSLWNSTNYSQYYGRGLRLALILKWNGKLTTHNDARKWILEMKYGLTHQFDRSSTSSGLQSIMSPTKQDISIQLRIQL